MWAGNCQGNQRPWKQISENIIDLREHTRENKPLASRYNRKLEVVDLIETSTVRVFQENKLLPRNFILPWTLHLKPPPKLYEPLLTQSCL